MQTMGNVYLNLENQKFDQPQTPSYLETIIEPKAAKLIKIYKPAHKKTAAP